MSKGIVRDIDKGFYQEAREKGVHPLNYLTQLVSPEPPEIDKIAERMLSRCGWNARGTSYEERVREWAYMCAGLEKELEVRGISRSDTIEKAFFASANAAGTQGLFPAFLASQIIAGQLAVSLVPVCCLSEVRINAHVQEKVQITDTTATRQTKHVAEGQDLPKTTIAKLQGSISLQKYGRMLEATYETVRLMHLDIISLQLQRMGRQIGIDETDDMIETMQAGDGNAGSTNTAIAAATSGTLLYSDVVAMWQGFPIGYEMRQVITNDVELRNIVTMAEFKDPMAGFQFVHSGVLPGPLGATWHRWTSTGSATFAANRILAVDDRLAMVLYREGDLLEEADQLIDKQIHRRSMTEWVGFMVWDPAGIVVMTV
jgi:hypothetical protein